MKMPRSYEMMQDLLALLLATELLCCYSWNGVYLLLVIPAYWLYRGGKMVADYVTASEFASNGFCVDNAPYEGFD